MDPGDAGRALRDVVAQDLLQAQRDRDRTLVRTLRLLLAAIDNAEAIDANQAVDYVEFLHRRGSSPSVEDLSDRR